MGWLGKNVGGYIWDRCGRERCFSQLWIQKIIIRLFFLFLFPFPSHSFFFLFSSSFFFYFFFCIPVIVPCHWFLQPYLSFLLDVHVLTFSWSLLFWIFSVCLIGANSGVLLVFFLFFFFSSRVLKRDFKKSHLRMDRTVLWRKAKGVGELDHVRSLRPRVSDWICTTGFPKDI